MRAFGFIFVTLMTAQAIWCAPTRAQNALRDSSPHLRISLVSETDTPSAGGTVALALATTPQPGWHGYWQNPGDAGYPAKLDWALPPGMKAGAPRYPLPERLSIAGLMNFVFERAYAPIVTLTIPEGLALGTKLPIKLHAAYLVCTKTLCVPESTNLAIDLTVGTGAIEPHKRAQFDRWRRDLPQPLGASATYQVADGAVEIALPYPASAKADKAYFYPLSTGAIDYAAPQTVVHDGDRLLLRTKGTPTGPLEGVLSVDGRGLAVTALPGVVGAANAPNGLSNAWLATLVALAGAILGGLILNVMPCVFPILSLKALSLVRAGGEERAARQEALAYTGGAVVLCLVLGATILTLRAGGSAVGWAFQLQDPRVVMLLLLLTVGISLNLGGVFEMPVPQFVNRTGSTTGAFVTGALAAFVATPCAGPFMAVALGTALLLPWPAALAVFAGLGLGLALPFLLLGYVPALRNKLPRPGAWMDTLRRFLSIPMWLTAVALSWLLGRQSGVNGMALALLIALGFATVLWAAGRKQARGLAFGTPALVMLTMIAVAGVWVIDRQPAPIGITRPEAFSETKLAQLRSQGRPAFVYFTADWCLTCKVNERVAIDTEAVKESFKRKNIVVLVGDWTNGDPVLGRFIEAHNRAGVPLYLYYPPGGAEPQVLPQVLTPATLEAL